MKNNFFLLAILSSFLTSNANAYSWIGTISLGPTWNSNGGKSQTFFLAPEVEKTYANSSPSNTLFDGELFLGLQESLYDQIQGEVGIALAATSDAKLSGDIWDDADAEFNNHQYQYNLAHQHVAIKGKLYFDTGYGFSPWVSASIGVGFNRAYAFYNTPTIFEALPNANFASHTKTAFTYTLGIGIQHAFCQTWQVGLGYEFADWGKSSLGRATGQTMNQGLTLNHFYTNGILFNISYLA